MDITDQHTELIKAIRARIDGWRKFTIGIDGVDHSGKSTLGRFLALELEMPLLEGDLFVDCKSNGFIYHTNILKVLVENRHECNRPLIIESVFLIRLLDEVNIIPDFLIRVEKEGHSGSITLQNDFIYYDNEYKDRLKPDFIFSWKEKVAS